MNALEPLLFATAHHAVLDVETKVARWLIDISTLRSVAVTEFAKRLADLDVPAGEDFAEHAEAQADVVIDRWCQQRNALTQQITTALSPDTIVVAQLAGMAPQLGDMIGLHLDNAVRDLDADLRVVIAGAIDGRR